MRFTAAELTEIRHAFRQRLATERVPKKSARRKLTKQRERRPLPVLVREPNCGDAEILTSARVAEAFGVSRQTIGLWADAGMLPSFRTLGGHRRYRWGDLRARLNWTSDP